MSTSIITASNTQGDNTQKLHWVYGTLTIGAGTYATGGLALKSVLQSLSDWFSSQPPLWVDIAGISGYIYQYNAATGKMMIFVPGGSGTPAGTIVSTSTAPTITTASGNPATAPIGVITGALAQTAGATGITGVQAPTITSTFTGSAGSASAAAEIANSGSLAGPIADTIYFRCSFLRFE
jgi:hypothetical protein